MSKTYLVPHEFSSLKVNNITSTTSIQPITTITATSFSLSSAETGKQIFLNNSAGVSLFLPPVSFATGYKYDIILSATHSSGSHLVTKNTADSANILGQVVTCLTFGSVSSLNVSKSTISFGTAGSVGDRLSIIGNGSKWFVSGVEANDTASFS